MDLSGAFQTRIYTSDGSVIDPTSRCDYTDISGYSFEGRDVHQVVDDSEPAPADTANVLRQRRNPPEEEANTEHQDVRSILDAIVEEQNQRRASFITKEGILYWGVHITSMVWNVLSWAAYYTKKAVVGAYEGVTDDTYYFFHSSAIPYQASKVKLSVAGSPRVQWTYKNDTQLFIHSNGEGRSQHLPYLAASIWHEDLMLYTISDFIEDCKYQGEEPPSPQHILAAWFLKTGILLDPSLPFVLKVVTEDGTDQEFSLQANRRE